MRIAELGMRNEVPKSAVIHLADQQQQTAFQNYQTRGLFGRLITRCRCRRGRQRRNWRPVRLLGSLAAQNSAYLRSRSVIEGDSAGTAWPVRTYLRHAVTSGPRS